MEKLDDLKNAIVDRLCEEAKRLAEIAIHSKGQAVDYYTGMKTGMARAAILVNGILDGHGSPIVDAEWMLKHGMIPDAVALTLPSIDEQKIAVEYCQKRNLVMITAESFEVLKTYYNRRNVAGERK